MLFIIKSMIVYKTTNLIDGKIYIGKDAKNDPKYLGSGILLKQAIKKHGRSNFIKEVLEYCSDHTINEREKYWIEFTQAQQIGYNLADGGQGGDLGEYVNKKRAKSLTGKVQPKEVREKKSTSLQGRVVTWGDKISQTMTGKTWKQKEERTKEHREKLSKANTGHKHSKVTVEKMSQSKKGKPSTTKGTYRVDGKCYSREEYEKYCTQLGVLPKKQLDLNDLTKKRAEGVLWKNLAIEYGYNKETIRIWYNKNKN
jgi:group I intron endonuclease